MDGVSDYTTASQMRNWTLSKHPKLDTYPEYRASIIIWKVVPPILILLGTIGNILTILVLTQKAIRASTTALYLTVLAFSDLAVLYTGLLRQWLVYCFGIDLRTLSEVGCKLHIWLVYSFLDFSSWILILVTLERVIAVWLPLKVKGICTRCRACASVVSVGVLLLLLNSHMLYGFSLVYSEENVRCNAGSHSYVLFFDNTWTWIDLCVFCMIPFFMIVAGNALILTKIFRSRNSSKSRISIASVSRNRTLYGKHSHMTVVLFTINVFFLVSTTPVSVYNINHAYWAGSNNVQTNARLSLTFSIVTMLMYSNNTFNFLLYCLTGTKFRQELIRMCCPQKPVTNTPPLSNIPTRTDDTYIVMSPELPRYRFLPE